MHKAFRFNVARTRSLMVIQPSVAFTASRLQHLLNRAEFEINKTVGAVDIPPDIQQKIDARFFELQNAMMQEDLSIHGTPQWDERVKEHHRIGAMPIDAMTRSPKGGTIAFDAMLASYIVNGWTAFETLAGDLWEAALNSSPKTLSQLAGSQWKNKNQKQAFGSIKRVEKNTETKSISLDLIQYHGFDLSRRMGTILKGKYEFTRLSRIREAYAAAFSKNGGQIEAILLHESFDDLSAVRNVLVHSAAFIDDEYLRRSEKLNVPKGRIREILKLDGENVVSILKPALERAAKLLGAVDEWIQKHS